jgi:hypothetical protein
MSFGKLEITSAKFAEDFIAGVLTKMGAALVRRLAPGEADERGPGPSKILSQQWGISADMRPTLG